ncbi:unnamed protein product [Durusdinium trenchii]
MMVLGALAPGGHWRRICDLARTFGLSESAFLSAFLSACNDWRLALVVLPHHPDATEVAAAQSSCGTCRQWRRVLRLLGSLQLSRQFADVLVNALACDAASRQSPATVASLLWQADLTAARCLKMCALLSRVTLCSSALVCLRVSESV